MKSNETYIYLLMILAANAGLIAGCFWEPLIFTTRGVAAGQWWRIFTHPFIHVSVYHLLLDTAAFFLLYSQLAQKRVIKRTMYVIGGGAGSLIAAMVVMPSLESVGYCGLSGICHGLMAICGLELLGESQNRRLGIFMLCVIGIKCIVEALSGNVVFDFIHSEMIGSPVAAAHLGGAIGGCAAYLSGKSLKVRKCESVNV